MDPLAAESLDNPENSSIADSDWFSLPTGIIDWLQSQDGLKIGGHAIESREGLEKAFQLLRCGEKTLQSGSIKASTIAELALRVAWTYVESIHRKRRPVILELTVPAIAGEVIERQCSSCRRRVLDDAFSRFAKRKRAATW